MAVQQRKKTVSADGAGRAGADRGFYAAALDEADKMDFELAQGMEGIDDEIALLRMKLRSLVQSDPDNIRMIIAATSTLARLVMTRYKISGDQKKTLSAAIGSVLRDIAIPLGIKYLP